MKKVKLVDVVIIIAGIIAATALVLDVASRTTIKVRKIAEPEGGWRGIDGGKGSEEIEELKRKFEHAKARRDHD